MNHFLNKLIRFLILPLLILSLLFIYTIIKVNRTIETSKIKFVYEKKRMDSLSAIKNKLIIIGGSNLLFGMDKYLLEKETKRPVVSFAYVRTDGIENMIRLSKQIFTEGDLILISLEYGEQSKGLSGEYLDYYLSNNLLEWFDIIKMTMIDFESFKNTKYSIQDEKLRNYIYASFDKNLYLTKLDSIQINFRKLDNYTGKGIALTYDSTDKALLKKFVKFDTIKMVGIHPILTRQSLNVKNLQQITQSEMDSLPISYITKQSNYLFDSAFIFDFQFHLNSNGRRIRTLKLAEDINQYFSQAQATYVKP